MDDPLNLVFLCKPESHEMISYLGIVTTALSALISPCIFPQLEHTFVDLVQMPLQNVGLFHQQPDFCIGT